MSGNFFAMGAIAALAAVGLARKGSRSPGPYVRAGALSLNKTGSRTVDAYVALRDEVQSRLDEGRVSSQDLAEYYPKTAKGKLKPYTGDNVFWSGRGFRQYGIAGPMDGTMVPIEARYVQPMPLNIFDYDKLAALVDAIDSGDRPVVHAGYAHLNLVTRGEVEESRDYAEDIELESHAKPFSDDDVGALTAQVRDGNHRSFAGLIVGADIAWVRMGDADKQDLIERRGEPRIDKLYTAIRRAQRDHGAPVFKRPRRKALKVSPELDLAEARYAYLKAEQDRLERLVYLRYYDNGESYAFTEKERLARVGMYLRLLFGRMRERDPMFLLELRKDPDYMRLAEVQKERTDIHGRLWDLRTAAGIDPRTGERATY